MEEQGQRHELWTRTPEALESEAEAGAEERAEEGEEDRSEGLRRCRLDTVWTWESWGGEVVVESSDLKSSADVVVGGLGVK